MSTTHPSQHVETSDQLVDPGGRLDLHSDADLLALFCEANDRQALAALIERYAPMVASLCRSTIADTAAAEDAFQATFLILVTNAKKVRRRSSIAAWLHGVAFRTSMRLRKKKRDAAVALDPEACQALVMEAEDAFAQLARRLDLEKLDEEISRLPATLRDPIVEHYLLGYSMPTIAVRMEMTIAAVEGRIRRGRKALRVRLARRGVGLSVALASAAWFQKQAATAEAGAWTQTLLAQSLTTQSSSALLSSSNSNVLELVTREQSMLNLSLLKSTLVGGAAICATAVLATSAYLYASTQTSGQGSSGGGGNIVAEDAADDEQIASFSASSDPFSRDDATNPTSQAEAGKGGTKSAPAAKPGRDVAINERRSWLQNGRDQIERIAKNRAALQTEIDLDCQAVPLRSVMEILQEASKTRLLLNEQELDNSGIAPESPITIYLQKVTLREALRVILQPLELDVIVRESGIEVTSLNHATLTPTLRYYDLSALEDAPAKITGQVPMLIERMIEPVQWETSGGSWKVERVGTTLVVSAAERAHAAVEQLLANLADH